MTLSWEEQNGSLVSSAWTRPKAWSSGTHFLASPVVTRESNRVLGNGWAWTRKIASLKDQTKPSMFHASGSWRKAKRGKVAGVHLHLTLRWPQEPNTLCRTTGYQSFCCFLTVVHRRVRDGKQGCADSHTANTAHLDHHTHMRPTGRRSSRA